MWLRCETPYLSCQLFSGISALESVAVFWNILTILSTVFRGSSSGKGGCVVKHPYYPVNCVQGFQLWKVWLCSETSQPSCQLCSGNPAPGKVGFCYETPYLCCQLYSGVSALKREAVLWNTLSILSTVFREFSSGSGLCSVTSSRISALEGVAVFGDFRTAKGAVL